MRSHLLAMSTAVTDTAKRNFSSNFLREKLLLRHTIQSTDEGHSLKSFSLYRVTMRRSRVELLYFPNPFGRIQQPPFSVILNPPIPKHYSSNRYTIQSHSFFSSPSLRKCHKPASLLTSVNPSTLSINGRMITGLRVWLADILRDCGLMSRRLNSKPKPMGLSSSTISMEGGWRTSRKFWRAQRSR